MAHQVSIADSTISSGDQEEERESPPSTPESEDSGKKSLLGKLKDKTMTKVSQLKKKVSQKKSVQSSGSSELKKDDSSDSSASSDEDEDTTTATKSAPKTVIGSAPESIAGATTPSQTEDAPSDLTLQADDTAPISQYRNEGPAGIMQAVPTQYRDYASERFQPAQLDYNSHTIQGQEPSECLSEAREIPAVTPFQSTSKKVEDADAQIPVGIVKPKDFDTVAYSHDTSGNLSPSDQSGEIAAADLDSVEAAETPQHYETKSHQDTGEGDLM